MSITFMVLGGPRSATTWAANWLTTDETLCLHDPLLEYTTTVLARLHFPGRRLGISCTGSLLYPDWVKRQDCPKVILFRDVADINLSLRTLGLTELIPSRHYKRVEALAKFPRTLLLPYEYMMTTRGGRHMAQHLGVPFSEDRHALLTAMRIEPMWKRIPVAKEAAVAFAQRIKEEIEA